MVVMWVNITVKKKTKEAILECIPLFLDAHPELKGKHISLNHIINQIVIYYKK